MSVVLCIERCDDLQLVDVNVKLDVCVHCLFEQDEV